MLTSTLIAEAMAEKDATNGWDAAYGMNLKQVNALFLLHYLENHPATTSMRLRVPIEVESQLFWMLEADVGPPRLAFRRDTQDATMEMQLVRAVLIAYDPDCDVIHSVSRMRPVESRLTGPLQLSLTAGEVDEVGRVVADLGAQAYTASIRGVDPKSLLQTKIEDAVKTYFAATNTKYPLATIAMGTTPKCLCPTSFRFYVQPKPGPDANDACVLLLIQTNGTPGVVDSLVEYPIPDGQTAALIINKAVLGELLVERLKSQFSALGWHFTYQPQNGRSWKVECVSGDLDFGVYGQESQLPDAFWSCTEHSDSAAPVKIPTGGFTVEPSGGKMSARWAPKHTQHWCLRKEKYDFDGSTWPYTFALKSVISPAFSQLGVPSVNENALVTFRDDHPSFTLGADGPQDFWAKIFSRETEVPDQIKQKMREVLEPPFHNFELPHVDAFALTSLLFPGGNAVKFKEAKLPGDLYLAGRLDPTLTVTPVDSVATKPSQQIAFQVAGMEPHEVVWSVEPKQGFGSIDEGGVYTAPRTMNHPAVVVVSATKKSQASVKGLAMVLLYTPATKTGFAVSPDFATVTAGHSVELTATDDAGRSIEVNWKTTPDVGKITHSHGKYRYTAPVTIDSAEEVHVEFSDANNPSHTFTTVISLRPSVKVTVSPSGSKVKPGGTLEMTAETGLDEETIEWSVFPIGAGSISVHRDRKSATYRAPANAGNVLDVTVFAYSIDDGDAVGIGAADLTLVP